MSQTHLTPFQFAYHSDSCRIRNSWPTYNTFSNSVNGPRHNPGFSSFRVQVQCFFTSTEAILRTVRDGESRSFTKLLSSEEHILFVGFGSAFNSHLVSPLGQTQTSKYRHLDVKIDVRDIKLLTSRACCQFLPWALSFPGIHAFPSTLFTVNLFFLLKCLGSAIPKVHIGRRHQQYIKEPWRLIYLWLQLDKVSWGARIAQW